MSPEQFRVKMIAKFREHRWPIACGAAAVVISLGVGDMVRRAMNHKAPASREQIELVVRDYILEHPEIIPEAMNRMREKQAEDAYAQIKAPLETPFGSAWAGAEHGDVTLVMFSDYACTYCRASVPDIDKLIAEDPKLKVVWREVPILGPGSEIAAKAALAAAVQGRFLDFHKRMFAEGRPDGAKASTVLRGMNLDLRRLQKDIYSPVIAAEIKNNLDLAGRLDDAIATPTFVVNGQMMKGAVGIDALKQAIADARKKETRT